MHAYCTTLPDCSNNLTDLPEDLGDLMHIRVLRIKYNQLSRLPAAVARLPGIVTLELSGNQISKLDSYVAKVCGKHHSSTAAAPTGACRCGPDAYALNKV
jgi:hypothetical protein